MEQRIHRRIFYYFFDKNNIRRKVSLICFCDNVTSVLVVFSLLTNDTFIQI